MATETPGQRSALRSRPRTGAVAAAEPAKRTNGESGYSAEAYAALLSLVPASTGDYTGDAVTKSLLFQRDAIPHMESLERFAYGLCHDAHWSRDLVQETMMKAFTHFDMYRQGTNCKAWLFKICKYSFINTYRRRQREPILMDFQDEGAQSDRGHGARYLSSTRGIGFDSASIDLHSPGMADEVMSALHRLPIAFQTAVILSDIEGHPYDEIAEFMHVPLGTVRSRLHRGRRMLEGLLSEYARDRGYLKTA